MPKPMLPVGERPLMEHIIQQLRQAGIKQLSLTTHYKKDIIVDHFGNGSDFGVEIQYVDEEHPMGTAGALSRLPGSDDPLLVINGDILTRVDFRAMLDFHKEQYAEMTVAVRQHETPVPFGVVEVDGVTITGILEKPVVKHLISAGIYLLDPSVCRDIPGERPYDMPELIAELLAQGRKVVSFPVREYWLDVGRPADYEQAQIDVKSQGFN
jgi:NDP-sugar pyrophosphorylase family protein